MGWCWDLRWEGEVLLGLGDTGGLAFGRWGTGEAAPSAQLPAPGVLAVGWVPPHWALTPVGSLG
jgi:hypothetical protein